MNFHIIGLHDLSRGRSIAFTNLLLLEKRFLTIFFCNGIHPPALKATGIKLKECSLIGTEEKSQFAGMD